MQEPFKSTTYMFKTRNTYSIIAILPLLVILLSVCSSCTTKKGKDADAQGSLPDEKTYENDFFRKNDIKVNIWKIK